MRLRRSGRLLYGFITLAAAAIAVAAFTEGSWLAFVCAVLLIPVAGYPAASGRDPLATSALVPEWMRTMEHRALPTAGAPGEHPAPDASRPLPEERKS